MPGSLRRRHEPFGLAVRSLPDPMRGDDDEGCHPAHQGEAAVRQSEPELSAPVAPVAKGVWQRTDLLTLRSFLSPNSCEQLLIGSEKICFFQGIVSHSNTINALHQHAIMWVI